METSTKKETEKSFKSIFRIFRLKKSNFKLTINSLIKLLNKKYFINAFLIVAFIDINKKLLN